ncbi:membrane protease subunit HflC [Bradyrhizobium sp. AZCC 1588]|uniref:protease modulator HflC n=1 Tax=unclassified Bradyrhizobium TaxID=2631580 RepID=UPI002FEFEC8C
MRVAFIGASAVAAVAGIVLLAGALFSVHPTQQALVIRFGEPVRVVTESGLKVKWPLIDRVVYIEKRILDLEAPVQEVIASDQKRLIVDAFARYRIHDPLRFYQAVGSIEGANSRLSTLMVSSLRRVLGEASFISAVRDERPQLMGRMREQVNRAAADMGIAVVDLRIRRVDLPEQNSQAVYKRMQTERQREAAGIRALGDQHAQEIRARAERKATIIVAEANSRSEKIRGEGDAARNAIFASAYGRDPDFFAFYRSMQAYKRGLASDDTRMLLTPNSEFFQYFDSSSGTTQAAN